MGAARAGRGGGRGRGRGRGGGGGGAGGCVGLAEEGSVALALVTLALGLSFDGGAWLGEVHVFTFDGPAFAGAVDVGDEDLWEAVEGVCLGHGGEAFRPRGVAADGDLGAVHVHLAVADLVEPCPGEEGLTGWSIGGDLELVLVIQRASTDHGVDDVEGLALVVGEGDLARATIVGSAALEFNLVLLTGLIVGHGFEGVVGVSLAGEIRPGGGQRVGVGVVLLAVGILVQRAADRERLGHLDVSECGRRQQSAGQKEAFHGG